MINFNELFKKDLIYDNIKSHQKTGLHPSLEDAFLEKPQGGSIFMISDFKFFQIIFLRQVNFGCIVGLTDILGLL